MSASTVKALQPSQPAVQPEKQPRPISSLVAQAVDGVFANATVISNYSGSLVYEEPRATLEAVRGMVKVAGEGNLSQAEAILLAQALALDSIFGNLACQAARPLSNGLDLERGERLLRLALKAQAQSRASLETLLTAKNPPVVIARQANISAGHQQVNNGGAAGRAGNEPLADGLRAEISGKTPIEVLEDTAHGERMDTGAAHEAVRCDQGMEAVGEVDGTTHTGGQGPKRAQRRPRRAQTSHA
jgi:hypothetical protein